MTRAGRTRPTEPSRERSEACSAKARAYRSASKEGTKQFSRRALDEDAWGTFAAALFYQQGSLEDSEAYRSLGARLDSIEQLSATLEHIDALDDVRTFTSLLETCTI